MLINVVVADKIVAIDDVARHCPELVAPDDWARAYRWAGTEGWIEPQTGPDIPYRDAERFDGIAVMQPFIDLWEANAPVDA